MSRQPEANLERSDLQVLAEDRKQGAMKIKMTSVFVYLLMSIVATAHGDVWPQFRGSNGTGVSSEKNLPSTWSNSSGVLWATKLNGRGNSSPAVGVDRVVVTTQRDDDSLWILEIDRNRGTIKRHTPIGNGRLVASGPTNLYAHRHNAASPSPIIEGQRNWAFFGSGQLVCADASSGEIVWQRDMPKDYGEYDIAFGMASTPRLWHELLIVSCLTKAASYVVAFNKSNGDEEWYVERRLPSKNDGPDTYSSPTIAAIKGKPTLLISGSDHVNAYDPESGKEIWVSDGLRINSPYGRIIASPVEYSGVVIATSANPAGGGLGHVLAIPGTLTGKILESKRLWKFAKTTPDSSTPVCVNGMVFMISDNGIATCADVKTGQVHWQKRLATGPYFASAVAGDSKVYFLNTDGVCSVVKTSPQFELISQNDLDGTFYATPAISDGVIYLRAHERLYAIK